MNKGKVVNKKVFKLKKCQPISGRDTFNFWRNETFLDGKNGVKILFFFYFSFNFIDFIRQLAERVGFEPTDGGYPSLVFKTSAFNRSAIFPRGDRIIPNILLPASLKFL